MILLELLSWKKLNPFLLKSSLSKANSRNGDVVVEEYMEGPEVSVETLTVDGICHVIQITDKLTTGAPHFVEMGHSQPSQLSPNIQKRIKDEGIIDALKEKGIQNGDLVRIGDFELEFEE